MGGLCVQVTFDGREVAAEQVEAMAAAAAHRGRDGSRVWVGEGAAFAAQRTVVLPEDEFDVQPLVQGGYAVVADARIDNTAEVAALLLRRGFLADDAAVTSAELILAAYRLWGDDCAAHLIGDFAFVVWDVRRRRLLAARDPMGMRALYYRPEPRRFLAATEIKQLLAAPDVPREIFEPAIAATLAGPRMPAGWTVYAGIEQLPPGHALTVDGHGHRIRRFWAPDPRAHFSPIDETAATEAFRDVFAESVRARLRSVREIGLFLSGGMDSGSVASMAGWLAEQGRPGAAARVRTYSWAFSELAGADERHISDDIVRRYPALVSTAVPADDGWPLAGYPDHTPDEDDPYSWVYQALIERTLARCATDGVGLVLNGDRGDELVGDWVYDELGLIRAGRLGAAWQDLAAATHLPGVSPLVALRRQVVRPMIAPRWPKAAAWLSPQGRRATPWPPWVPDSFARRVALDDVIADQSVGTFGGPARTTRYHRIFLTQAARIAVLRERTRARFGMAFADPYSDRRLVELVLSMPQWLVQRRTDPKRLARSAMAGIMPESARRGAYKTIPYSLFDRGLRDRAVPVVDQLLHGSQAAAHGWLDERAVQEVYAGYRQVGDSRWDFWWPLTVEMWLRRWWAPEAPR